MTKLKKICALLILLPFAPLLLVLVAVDFLADLLLWALGTLNWELRSIDDET